MKTRAVFAVKGQYIIFSALILLSSCKVYEPLTPAHDTTPENIMQKVHPGKHYAFLMEGGKTIYLKVDSVMADRVNGKARISVNMTQVRQDNYTIFVDAVRSVKERKVSAPLTVGMAVGVAAVAIVAGAQALDDMFVGHAD